MKGLLFGASDDDPGTAATFAYVASVHNINWSTTENRREIPTTDDFSVSDLKVVLDTAPGVGSSRIYTLRKNGVDTGVTLTIADNAVTNSWAGTVSWTEGDTIALKQTTTGSPTAPGNSYWYLFLSTTGQKALLMGGGANLVSASAVNYANPFGQTAWVTTQGDNDVVVPLSCTFTKARYLANVVAGAAKSYAVSLRVNNTTDALTGTISGAVTAHSGTVTGSQAGAAGDTIQIKSDPTGTPTAVALSWCITYEPAVNGEQFHGFGISTALSTSATQYNQPLGTGAGYSTSESIRLMAIPAVSYKNLYVRLGTATGAAPKARTFTMRDNNASSALTVTITGAATTTGSDTTHTVVHTADQVIAMQHIATSTPAASDVHYGYVIAVTQPAVAATGATQMLMGV